MSAAPLLLLLLLVALGCRGNDTRRTDLGQPGVAADSVLNRTGDTVETAAGGLELEAPRLIPGLRAQLSAMRDSGPGYTEGNVAAYRQLAADVVTAMETDLNRAGSAEAEPVSELGDSVTRLIGGGAGEAPEPGREDVMRSVEMLERLIDRYQRAMRAAQP